MTAGNHFDPNTAEPELFSALLTPHRSLNRTGFLLLMAFLSLISFAAGMVFLMLGAWPVVGFFGLDILAVYLAFKINFRRAQGCEEIWVTPSQLRVRRGSFLSPDEKASFANALMEALQAARRGPNYHPLV